MNELVNAFASISKQQAPPLALAELTYSESRLYERALKIYPVVPDPAEIRAAFHCRRASAEKIHRALKQVLCTDGESL